MGASKDLVSKEAKAAEERLDRALDAIAALRERMFAVRDPSTVNLSNGHKLTLLACEFGDVATEVSNGVLTVPRRACVRQKLLQLATFAVAWSEALDDSERTVSAQSAKSADSSKP